MRMYTPVLLASSVVIIFGSIAIYKKEKLFTSKLDSIIKTECYGNIGNFFLDKGIEEPVTIDLTQKHYKGIALYHGENKVYHPKSWERFEYFTNYTADKDGNLYLTPMPFVSIKSNTFSLLKNLYKIDTNTGELDKFMYFDDVIPSATNPHGLNALIYDCIDHSLWISAIDESNYETQKGVIYHVDIEKKKILSIYEGWDAISLAIIKTNKNKFLLFGSARDSSLYAIKMVNNRLVSSPIKLFDIPNPNEHIRSIKVERKNKLFIQTIPFSYSLITESSEKDGNFYDIFYDNINNIWDIRKR